jgi:drug/metabolite transporter (DMT)-like permease
MKHLVATYPAMQVTFLRGIASMPLLIGAVGMFGRWRDLRSNRWHLHLLRGVLSVLTLAAFVYSVRTLSLADAYTIFMSAPLLITALSVPFLGERVGASRWMAVLVGLGGVMLVLNPTGGGFISIGGMAALLAALGYALNAITIRILSRTDSSWATVFWAIASLTVIAGVASARDWVPIEPESWLWIGALGITGALGQFFITDAFRRAPAPVIAPLEYTALAWGMLFDWIIWVTAPTARMLLGAGVIVASGLYVLHQEHQSSRRAQG